jgi:hypothetical protein
MYVDSNLKKIRDANLSLIKQNRFGLAITQAKDYLLYILGENRMDQVNRELDDFVAHMKTIFKDQAINENNECFN